MTARWSRALVVSAVFCLLASSFARPLEAQRSQPVYPAYDGFSRNPDGTLILSFAYFNHNGEPVTIPPGPGNLFAPEPGDRHQPTRFMPGHQRFQCVMVVGPEFDGKLRWTVSFAATTTTTSQDMLQYSWELDENGARQARRGIEIASAPKGVCLNRPPVVRVLGLANPPASGGELASRQATRGLSVTLPEELRLFGSVEDEGLPRSGTLSAAWKTISGPGTVTFSHPNAPRTRASFSAAGTYVLELSASDSERDARTQVTVVVSKP